MKQMYLSVLLAAAFACAAQGALADCFADYKAKQDNPLRLHYGVAQIATCSKQGAQQELTRRLAANGWTLLGVVSVFDEQGLAERKPRAGQYFLRF